MEEQWSTNIVRYLRTLSTNLSCLVESTCVIPRTTLEAFESGLERTYRELLAYEVLTDITQQQSEAIECERSAMGFLRGAGVQQSRIRDAQRRVDPQGVLMRQLTVIRRRQYNVRAPLSLYHIDGNHKLIRWVII